MIRLYTSFYPINGSTRQAELLSCLRRNLECSAIDVICLLLEKIDEPPMRHAKLQWRQIDHRPTYQDFFDWSNENVQSSDDVSIITNSDIYFDDDLRQLVGWMRPHHCVALTRWNIQPDGKAVLFDRNDSQDSWIFCGMIRPFACDYHIGVPRCDNRILHELEQAGYEVINPAFSVRSFHLHAGDREEYVQEQLTHFVDPPYAYMWPHNLMPWPRLMAHNLTHPRNPIRCRVNHHWLKSTLPIRAARKLGRMFRGQN